MVHTDRKYILEVVYDVDCYRHVVVDSVHCGSAKALLLKVLHGI